METLPHICQIIEAAQDFNNNLISKAIISCAPTNPLINEVEDAKNLLSDFTEYLDLAKTFIRDRKVYRDALLQGKGVVELDNAKALDEIKNLVNEILECN